MNTVQSGYKLTVSKAQAKVDAIRDNPVMQQILSDSFGGIMYNTANRHKYNTINLLAQWDKLTPTEQDLAGGIIKGAINFIQDQD